jgi:hypothetical protein
MQNLKATRPMVAANLNEVDLSQENLGDGQKIARLAIDIMGLLQNRLADYGCTRHADIMLKVRHNLGEAFSIPISEANPYFLYLDVSRELQHYSLFDAKR